MLKFNYPISKKSKNSRMGKGKGTFLRWVISLKINSIIMKILTLNNLRLKKIFFMLSNNILSNIIIKNLL